MEKVKGKVVIATYMNNINMNTVHMHRAVMEKLAPQYEMLYAKTSQTHAETIDTLWKSDHLKVFDTFMFIDIDAVPLKNDTIFRFFEIAAQGAIVGDAQRTNHLENNQHVFAAPSALCLSRETFEKLGSPSAVHTARGDVCEEYTYKAEELGVSVALLMPQKFDAPVFRMDWEKDRSPTWKLKDGQPEYGIGTTFAWPDGTPAIWHCFQSFHPGQQERFWSKCAELLGNNAI